MGHLDINMVFDDHTVPPFSRHFDVAIANFAVAIAKKARPRFELGISSLLVRRFNQLSHRAMKILSPLYINELFTLN